MQDVLDYQVQHYLRQWICELPAEQRQQLKNIYLCNQHVNPYATGGEVYLLSSNDENGDFSKLSGLMTCKNTWCCPICSAIQMEKYRSYIADGIDMLKPTHFGFMVTLTIPHLYFMGWRETMDILYDSWKYFRMKTFQRSHGHVFHEFNKEIPCDNWVRVAEFTWSKKNGAHPHFHCIWWCERGKENKVLDWEEKLNDFWLRVARSKAIKYWKKYKLHTDRLTDGMNYEQLADKVFMMADKGKDSWRQALRFSRDENGNLLEAQSSDYICGWGADREVTGNIRKKASHEEHYTPYQILELAQTHESMKRIYLDFCLAVTRKPVHHRVNFSKNMLFARIKEYRKQKDKLESGLIKKQKKKDWEVLCWFSELQWYYILDLSDETKSPIIANLLYLARLQDKEILLEYMDNMGIGYNTTITTHCLRYMQTYQDTNLTA